MVESKRGLKLFSTYVCHQLVHHLCGHLRIGTAVVNFDDAGVGLRVDSAGSL